MKKFLFAAAAIAAALSAGSAFAADLPSKKAPILPPPPPPPVWTGFYVGLNAGYTWGESNNAIFAYTDTGPAGFSLPGVVPGSLPLNNDGFIGGGQIGYNYQFNHNFVVGVEADIQGVATDTKTASYAYPGGAFQPTFTQASRSLDYLGTVRGRLGYTLLPNLLVYATGGLAYGQANLSQSFFGPTWGPALFASTSFSDTRVGWTVGGGAEYLFLPNWSAKVEYLYYDLGRVTAPQAVYAYGGAVTTAAASSRFDGHIVRAGVNYHFNWATPAPVVAKF